MRERTDVERWIAKQLWPAHIKAEAVELSQERTLLWGEWLAFAKARGVIIVRAGLVEEEAS